MATIEISEAGGKWSETAAWVGAKVPGVGDDVIALANGKSGSLTVTATAECRSIDFTNYSKTFTVEAALKVGTSTSNTGLCFRCVSAMTLTFVGTGKVEFVSTSGTTEKITMGTKRLATTVFEGTGGVWQFQDEQHGSATASVIELKAGTLETNGQTCVFCFNVLGGTLKLGASTVSIQGNPGWKCAAGATLEAGTSAIEITTNSGPFEGGGKTYNTVTLASTNTVVGNNTFATLNLNSTKQLTFTASSVQTVTTLATNAKAGAFAKLASSAAGTRWKISSTSKQSLNFVEMKDGEAEGTGAPFNAGASSLNLGNNARWLFPSEETVWPAQLLQQLPPTEFTPKSLSQALFDPYPPFANTPGKQTFFEKALTASLSFAGTLQRNVLNRGMTASLTFAGTIVKNFSGSKALVASLSFVGTPGSSELPLSLRDSFKRGGSVTGFEKPLGAVTGQWTEFLSGENTSTKSLEVSEESAWSEDTFANGECSMYWNVREWSGRQVVAVFLKHAAEINERRLGLFLCIKQRAGESGTEHSYYWCRVERTGANEVKVKIYKRTKAGGLVQLQEQTGIALKEKDSVALELNASKLQLWRKQGEAGAWATVGAPVEDSELAEGFSGIGLRGTNEYQLQNFEVGAPSILRNVLNVAKAASLTFAGSVGRNTVGRALNASLSFAGTLQRGVFNRSLVASLSFVGSLSRPVVTKLFHTAEVTFNLHPIENPPLSRNVLNRGLAASLTFVGTIVKNFSGSKALAAKLTFAGSLQRGILNRAMAASLTFTGTVERIFKITQALTASLSFAGTMQRSVLNRVEAASLTFAGTIAKNFAGTKSLTASLSFAGTMQRSVLNRVEAASLTFVGALQRSVFGRAMVASLSFVGTLQRSILGRALTASLSFVGTLTRKVITGGAEKVILVANLSFTGTLERFPIARKLALIVLQLIPTPIISVLSGGEKSIGQNVTLAQGSSKGAPPVQQPAVQPQVTPVAGGQSQQPITVQEPRAPS